MEIREEELRKKEQRVFFVDGYIIASKGKKRIIRTTNDTLVEVDPILDFVETLNRKSGLTRYKWNKN